MSTLETESRLEPYQIATDTFVIPWGLEAPPIGHFPMNSMIIRGAEPMLVDTGAPASREAWLAAAWEVVDPADVKWVFLSHDDRDHSGNLLAVLDACPNATLLTTWFSVGRMFEEWATPLDRVRFLNDNESIDIGDRTVIAKRPPVFDNPVTRGLFDPHTGVYWAVDTFATNVPKPLVESSELSDTEFRDGQFLGGPMVAPWHQYLDPAKWNRCVDEVAALDAKIIAGCHTPTIREPRIPLAIEFLRQLPGVVPWADFTQADLEMWMSAAEVPEQAASASEIS